MQRIFCALAVLAFPLAATADEAVKKELKALEGSWKAVSLEAGGKPLPKDSVPEFTFVIGADGKSTGKMAGSEYGSTIAVDPKKDPKTLDNTHDTGDNKGKKQHGIYKLDGDKLTVCITAPGSAEADRPKDFTTKDSAHVLFVFERVKEAKKK